MAEEKREITGVRSAPTHTENPFLDGTVTEVKGKKKFYNVLSQPAVAMNPKTGEFWVVSNTRLFGWLMTVSS